ncbi:MAG: FAD-dependent oxidoreductase [Candidatus Margulisbacteria bacterium]|nr:FAD-dependent oxidoreductase [Candidatus Margulisiibacteriota bacterium]
MINITINNKQYSFPENTTILKAAAGLGISIPTLCHDDKLEHFNSCWICVVELVSAGGKLVPACSTQISEGMILETNSPKVISTRKMALELLLSDHFGDCVAPCKQLGCPAMIDIQGFLALEAQGKYKEAAALIREKAPIPNILGRVCPKPCEKACRRNRVDEPVRIGIQKRFISEKEIAAGGPFLPEPGKIDRSKNIAIIGAGPAGISAAYYLRLLGYNVVIYEKQPKSGGMLRYGIPAYRLPKEIVDIEFDAIIKQLGIAVKFDCEVGKQISWQEIYKNHDAVILAIGCQLSNDISISGENNPKVLKALDFLQQLNSGNKPVLGKEIVVVGGGHTAMDSARSAIRLGSKVKVLYRRSAEEMPAKDEIAEAEEEGIVFEFLAVPLQIEEAHNKLILKCQRMQLSTPDASGRRKPVPVEGSDFVLGTDNIISAIGQHADLSFLSESLKDNKGKILADNETFQLKNDCRIFVIGDVLTGPDLVVTAVAHGRKAAHSVIQYLQEQEVVGEKVPFVSLCGELNTLPEEMFAEYKKIQRRPLQQLDIAGRKTSFAQIEQSQPETDMQAEAERCLKCGCVAITDCLLKKYADEYGADQKNFAGERRTYAKDFSHPQIKMEIDKCINCSSCVRVCEDLKKLYVFGFINRGFATRMKPEFNHHLAQTVCDGCGECVKVCPTAGVNSPLTPL